MEPIKIVPLGQAGFRFGFNRVVIYIDPYLSDHVAELEGEHLRRMVPIPFLPESVMDVDWVLITHIHLDHCDPATLVPLANASPQCRFIGPNEVIQHLKSELGIASERLLVATERWIDLGDQIKIRPVPATHKQIEEDTDGYLRFIGYVIDFDGRRLYHSGDTSVHKRIVSTLRELAPIDVAFLPVNECNYYRDRQGIIGNMSIREAFGMAEEISVSAVVPMHYDMFRPNCVYLEEIRIIYDNLQPDFKLIFNPREL